MKIAYVANIRFPTERAHGAQIAKACEALTKSGETVELLVPARSTHILTPALEYYYIKQSFRICMLGVLDLVGWGKPGFWIESLTFAMAVVQHLRANPADVVYGRDELVLWFLHRCGIKNIVWESHDGTWNRASRYIAKHCIGIVVVSKGLEEFYKRNGVPAEKIRPVPNGISLSDFTSVEPKEVARERLGLPQDKHIVLYIGRLDGWKGTDTLLLASDVLPDDYLVALIGGEPNQIAQLESRYTRARFLGSRPYRELANNQAAADVLVVPNTAKNDISVRFTSPLKLIAHMASKRPIVASDLPSIRELVNDSSAVLVQPDNPHALAEGIQRALHESAIAEQAYAQVQSLDWSYRAQSIIDFIRTRMVV